MHGDVKYLLEAVETAFEVKFEPGELGDSSRFEDLCKALRSHLGDAASHRCFTSIVFWRLRQALVDLLHTPKGSIRPSTAVESVIPAIQRQRYWRALSEATGLKLPGLDYSRRARLVLSRAWWVPPVLLVLASPHSWWSWMAAVLAAPVTICLLSFPIKPLATSLPGGSATFGDLAKTVAGLNYGSLAREFGPSSDRDLVEALGYAIGDLFGGELGGWVNELVVGNPSLIDIAEDAYFRCQV